MRLCLFGAFALLATLSCANAIRPDFWKNKIDEHGPAITGLFEKLGQSLSGLFNKMLKKKMAEKEPTSEKPAFCRSYECPPFKAVNKTADYELRCYSSQNWVSTSDFGYPTPMGYTSSQMFMRLFRYISGANSEKTKIKMTVPVLMRVEGKGSRKQMVMSFYVPEKFQKNTPKPTDPKVKMESKKFCAYVRSFSGYTIFYKTIQDQANALKKSLDSVGLQDTYNGDVVMSAGYNKPTDLFGRHNEVMLMKV